MMSRTRRIGLVNLNKAETKSLVYEGSVKRLWQAPNDDLLWFEFTDDYSIFDWGKMPDTISNKGKALALLGTYFFKTLEDPGFWTRLESARSLSHIDKGFLACRFENKLFDSLKKNGLPHHFKRLTTGGETFLLSDSQAANRLPEQSTLYMEVLKAEVLSPKEQLIDNKKLFFYPPFIDNPPYRRLVPLEVVFRFGMSEGSSLKERLAKNPDYARSLGFTSTPEPDTWFAQPVVEFFTKLEPTDRLLSYQEAVTISGLNPTTFEQLLELTFDLALALYHIFAQKKLELWDGKFEFLIARESENSDPYLALADSIGPDELRLLYKGKQLSKELIRQIYKGSSWELAVRKAKELTKDDPSVSFKQRCLSELGEKPAPLAADARSVVDRLYPVLANHLTDNQLFSDAGSLDDLVNSLNSLDSSRRTQA